MNEACAVGLPLVLSDRVGARTELLKEGRNGFVVPSRDSTRFAEAIVKIVQDKELRKKMSAESLKLGLSLNFELAMKSIQQSLQTIGLDLTERENPLIK